MSWLAPLYALGLLAIGLPVIFHLIRRQPQGQVLFSSLMFLSPSPPRLTRRSRLDNLLLLLLRATALVLLAAAFTRPLWRQAALQAVEQPQRRTVLLVDTSASMRREDLWQQALAHVEQQLADLQPTDEIALCAFDAGTRVLVDFEDASRLEYSQRPAAIRAALGSLTPTWAATDLGAALSTTADRLERARDDAAQGGFLPPTIVLITDLQQGSRLNRLETYEWPAEIKLDLRQVSPKSENNARASVLTRDDDSEASTGELRVRIQNSPESTQQQFGLAWENAASAPAQQPEPKTQVPPGESRVVRIEPPADMSSKLVLTGDDQPFDNTQYVARYEPEEKTLVYLGDDPADERAGLLYYLRQASFDTIYQTVRVDARDINAPLDALDPNVVPLVVVSDPLPAESLDALQSYLRAGGRALAVLSGTAEQFDPMINCLRQLASLETLTIEEADVRDYAMLSSIDFEHALFRPFADPRFSDFTKIRFWKHRRLGASDESPWQVLARFDSLAPALVERQMDEGKLWILTAGWQPEESQLALSTKFIPLLAGMLDLSGAQTPLLSGYVVGDRVAVGTSTTPAEIVSPDGARVRLEGVDEFAETDEPGIYRLLRDGREQPFAVNLAAEESQTAPLERDRLEQFGIPLGPSETMAEMESRQRQLKDVELENRQKLWRWLTLAALVTLAAETWLAGRLARRAPKVETG